MKIVVAVLAYNEAERIEAIIDELGRQTTAMKDWLTRVLIVPNGCSDKTASVATRRCEEIFATNSLSLSWAVHEVKERVGKVGAWNLVVHQLAADADVLVFLDADVSFFTHDELARGVKALQEHPEAVLAAGWPRRVELGRRTIVSAVASASAGFVHDPNSLCGQHYAIRGTEARRLWMPIGLTLEDGFLRALMLTQFFTLPEDTGLARVDSEVGFQPETTITGLYRHELSVTLGMTILVYLFERFHEMVARGEDVERFLREQFENDPQWLHDFGTQQIAKRGPNCVPSSIKMRRLQRLSALSKREALLRFPAAFAGWCFDQVVIWRAQSILRSGEWFGQWKSNPGETSGQKSHSVANQQL
jgi:hypothetical protein